MLTSLGLLALSAALSFYWVLFFVSARVAVHRFRIPLLVAMPVCWIGCEYLRSHLLGGFSFCALEHAFYLYPSLIQLASMGGSLLVGGMIMFLGAAGLTYFCVPDYRRKTIGIVFALLMLIQFVFPSGLFFFSGFILFLGVIFLILFGVFFREIGVIFILLLIPLSFIEPLIAWSKRETATSSDFVKYSIVALQGNRQIYLHSDPVKAHAEAAETFKQFVDLTYQTIYDWKQKGKPLPDLIIFPETVCHIPVLQFEGSVTPADIGLTEEEADWETTFRQFAQRIETPVLLGLSTYTFKDDPERPIRLNSALLVQPQYGEEPSRIYRYDKMHLVMFGEYIPFTEYLPDNFFLKTVCPEAEHGNKPVAIPIGEGRADSRIIEASINICFESSVARLVRHQILSLRKEGHDPRVLINLSNDGWFRFSQAMEQHLATHVFRAVENRKWYITATNGGFSAAIDPYGTIERIGKRGTAEAVDAVLYLEDVNLLHGLYPLTIYQRYGDWYALICAIGVVGLAGFAVVERRGRNVLKSISSRSITITSKRSKSSVNTP
jgi:apolipoprotein N-acyltransferase